MLHSHVDFRGCFLCLVVKDCVPGGLHAKDSAGNCFHLVHVHPHVSDLHTTESAELILAVELSLEIYAGYTIVAKILLHASLGQRMETWVQVLHRLDMDTTGVMLFAKDPCVVSAMHTQFRRRKVSKTYMAICLAAPSATRREMSMAHTRRNPLEVLSWDVHAPLDRHPRIAAACCVSSEGKSAQTHIIVRAENHCRDWHNSVRGEAWSQRQDQNMHGACLLECQPLTGACPIHLLVRPICHTAKLKTKFPSDEVNYYAIPMKQIVMAEDIVNLSLHEADCEGRFGPCTSVQ